MCNPYANVNIYYTFTVCAAGMLRFFIIAGKLCVDVDFVCKEIVHTALLIIVSKLGKIKLSK